MKKKSTGNILTLLHDNSDVKSNAPESSKLTTLFFKTHQRKVSTNFIQNVIETLLNYFKPHDLKKIINHLNSEDADYLLLVLKDFLNEYNKSDLLSDLCRFIVDHTTQLLENSLDFHTFSSTCSILNKSQLLKISYLELIFSNKNYILYAEQIANALVYLTNGNVASNENINTILIYPQLSTTLALWLEQMPDRINKLYNNKIDENEYRALLIEYFNIPRDETTNAVELSKHIQSYIDEKPKQHKPLCLVM